MTDHTDESTHATSEAERYRDLALRAAAQVAPALAHAHKNPKDVSTKSDRWDLLTEFDPWCESQIWSFLSSQVPNSVIFGEEGGIRRPDGSALELGEVGDDTVMWIVDPIDGTSNFAAGLPYFCISIGVARGGKMLAGVISAPALDLTWSANDHAAFFNGEPLTTPPAPSAERATLVTDYPQPRILQARPETLEDYREMSLAFQTLRRTGSCALDLAFVACGWASACLAASPKPWDFAGGAHIATQAGARFIPYRDGELARGPLWNATSYQAVGPGGDYPLLGEILSRGPY